MAVCPADTVRITAPRCTPASMAMNRAMHQLCAGFDSHLHGMPGGEETTATASLNSNHALKVVPLDSGTWVLKARVVLGTATGPWSYDLSFQVLASAPLEWKKKTHDFKVYPKKPELKID